MNMQSRPSRPAGWRPEPKRGPMWGLGRMLTCTSVGIDTEKPGPAGARARAHARAHSKPPRSHPEQGSTHQLDIPSEASLLCVDPEETRHFRRAGVWRCGPKWAVRPVQRLWQTLVGLFSQMVTFRVHSGGCCSPLKQPLLFLTKICLFRTKISPIFIPKFKKITKMKKV